MELEPITRKEKIIAGQDLTPITRLEMFLKQFGGGGGGGGSTDAVLYTEQTLTEAQKKQARENVDAAVADFVINGTANNSDSTVTLDKTFVQIQEAIQAGKKALIKVNYGSFNFVLPLSGTNGRFYLFTVTYTVDYNKAFMLTIGVGENESTLILSKFPAFDTDGSLPQAKMASAPTKDMQIATKKYVDDKECILKSTTPGSTKKFKITVDDSGAISATEVT